MTRKLSDVLKAASVRPYSIDKERGRLWGITASDGFRVALEADVSDALLLAHAANQIEGLVAALRELADCSPCRNGCAPDDMACASNKARAALAKATTIDL